MMIMIIDPQLGPDQTHLVDLSKLTSGSFGTETFKICSMRYEAGVTSSGDF